eukprot:m.47424 g.47424  ORF g.47424 m.47424 type:complete len:71 (-) comp15221_c1_seq2:157-369(-)
MDPTNGWSHVHDPLVSQVPPNEQSLSDEHRGIGEESIGNKCNAPTKSDNVHVTRKATAEFTAIAILQIDT